MNISLRWIFDHLESSYTTQITDIAALIQKISTTITEIESCKALNLDLDCFSLVTIREITIDQCSVFSDEYQQQIQLPLRTDIALGMTALAIRHDQEWRWATLADVGSCKDGYMPPVYCSSEKLNGSWKDDIESSDYILTISNTSITHRPDLWGHRGFARELATLLAIPLKPEAHLLAACPEQSTSPNSSFPFTISIENHEACSRFSGMYIATINNQASNLIIAFRLARIDARPRNAIVDLTNYVMFDWGQPLHAFDAAMIGKNLTVSLQKDTVSLELLDGTTKMLPPSSIVVRDEQQVLSLAGIMGGAGSSVSSTTTSVFFEAAHFSPHAIRIASTKLHLRTESSARFEKGLDSHQTTKALARAAFIAYSHHLIEAIPAIISVGNLPAQRTITVEHSFIEKLLGINLTPSFIIQTLQDLGFGLYNEDNQAYRITIPSWRAQEIKVAADIVEEIGRFYGFDNLPLLLPNLPLKPHCLDNLYQIRTIKEYCAFAGNAHEVIQYPLLDEEFLRLLNWQPTHPITLKNPVAQTAKIVTPSLIPLLLKALLDNSDQHEDALRFFQINAVWNKNNNDIEEHQSLAGLFFDANIFDFYSGKEFLNGLFHALQRTVSWHPANQGLSPWFHPYQTAQLRVGDIIIGYAGMIMPPLLSKIRPGSAFAFEINSEKLLAVATKKSHFKLLAKYPDSWLDISLLAPQTLTVAQLEQIISATDSRIFKVSLQDIFYKDEWLDKRSVLIRFFIRDYERTLNKEDINQLHEAVKSALEGHGVLIR